MTLNTNIENRFNLTYIYSLKDRQGEQERDTEKIERWRKKTSRVWKVSLINILSYTVGWRVPERRGSSAQASLGMELNVLYLKVCVRNCVGVVLTP